MNRKSFAILLTAVLTVFLLWYAARIPYCGWDFRNSLWGPASMLLHGQTPYTIQTPYGAYAAVWMPPGIGFLFWLGFLSCDTASKIWLVLQLAGFVWVIWLVAGGKLPSRRDFLICILAFFLFPPLWLHVQLGQISLLFVILMAAVVYLPQAEPWVPLLLALGLTKPQLALIIYPGLVLHAWRWRGFRPAARLAVLTLACTLLSLLPIFALHPAWLGDFVQAVARNVGAHWDLPNLYVQMPLLFGPAGYALWALALLACLGAAFWLWLRQDPRPALLVSLAVTPMVTPYSSSWDFVFLLPAFFWLVFNLRSRLARALLFLGMGGLFALQLALRWGQDYPDGRQWWIPPGLILLYLLALGVENRWFLNFKPRSVDQTTL